MLCQLSYAVRSVQVCDISELFLVPSISVYSNNHDICCVGVMYSGEYDACNITSIKYTVNFFKIMCLQWLFKIDFLSACCFATHMAICVANK